MVKIEIKTGNDAFQDGNYYEELAKILRELADKIEHGNEPEKLMDSNGNAVGKVKY